MNTLSVSEAGIDLSAVLAKVIAGEEIGIRSGDTIIALRPLSLSDALPSDSEKVTPIEALGLLQKAARLTPSQAESYLKEVRAERLATDERCAA